MANTKNLVRNEDRTPEQRRINASKAGKASGEKRKERKSLRESLLMLLKEPVTDKDGKELWKSSQEAIVAGVIRRAIAGDVRAAEFIRDTIGEKPESKMDLKAQLKMGDFEIIVEPEAGDGYEDQD